MMRLRGCLLLAMLISHSAANAEDMALDGMAIVGNSELPKSLVIVPWHEAAPAAVPQRPLNTLINQALEPVDPDVFRRELQYYDAVHNNP